MKKIILFLCVVALLLCTTNCNDPFKSYPIKGNFAKDIPKCLKKVIKDNTCITSAEEYCNTAGTKKIYILEYHPSVCIPAVPICPKIIDENCNSFYIYVDINHCFAYFEGEELAYFLSDETVEYKGEVYHLKRNVFITKSENYEKY